MIDARQALLDAWLSGATVGKWHVTNVAIRSKGSETIIADTVISRDGRKVMEWLSGDGIQVITVELREAEQQ